VSDTSALRFLLKKGAQIRGICNLHAKLYLFGSRKVIATSANLTDAALSRNHEFGFVSDEPAIVAECQSYFEGLWVRAEPDLEIARLHEWEQSITAYLLTGARPRTVLRLRDEGVDIGIPVVPAGMSGWVVDSTQSFLKFFGRSTDNRADRKLDVPEEVRISGCHWACAYPVEKRPRIVKDGAVMFMGRLVKDPDDILVYGRAVAIAYQSGRDDATDEDIRERNWKEKWPHYIRVHDAEFISGTLKDGISFYELLSELKADALASTQRNAIASRGNTDPRRAYMRQAAVELSPQGCTWLNDRLERAYQRHGRLSPAVLAQLDWPIVPNLLHVAPDSTS
jgi:hypothetical protein